MSTEDVAVGASVLSTAYILLENPKKSTNQGPVLRCAAAFGVKQVVFVGYEKCSVEGSHGANKHLNIVAFPTVEQAVRHIRDETTSEGRDVYFAGLLGGIGVSNDADAMHHLDCLQVCTHDDTGLAQVQPKHVANEQETHTSMLEAKSYPVYSRPFEEGKDCCFVLNLKGRRGLTPALARHCEIFIHIPHQVADNPTLDRPLLDLPVSLSIALHHFTEWAHYDELAFTGHKFEVKRKHGAHDRESIETATEARKLERLEKERESEAVVDLSVLFGVAGCQQGDY